VCRIHPHCLEYTCFGKPHPSVFKNAEIVLQKLVASLYEDFYDKNHKTSSFKTLYMIGDNPAVDIRGARQVCLMELDFTCGMVKSCLLTNDNINENVAFQTGHPWFSILTRTGVFKGKENHDKFSADLVIPCVSPLEKSHKYVNLFPLALLSFLGLRWSWIFGDVV